MNNTFVLQSAAYVGLGTVGIASIVMGALAIAGKISLALAGISSLAMGCGAVILGLAMLAGAALVAKNAFKALQKQTAEKLGANNIEEGDADQSQTEIDVGSADNNTPEAETESQSNSNGSEG